MASGGVHIRLRGHIDGRLDVAGLRLKLKCKTSECGTRKLKIIKENLTKDTKLDLDDDDNVLHDDGIGFLEQFPEQKPTNTHTHVHTPRDRERRRIYRKYILEKCHQKKINVLRRFLPLRLET